MHVMHVISALQLGGAERVAIDLAIHHARDGLCSAVVAIREPNKDDDPVGAHLRAVLQENQIPFFEIGSAPFRVDLAKLPFRLCRLIDRYSPDLVHSHTDVPDFVVSGARRLRRFRVARTIHNTALWETHWAAGYVTEQGLKDDLIIGVSNDALTSYKTLRQKYGLSASRHQRVIRNGVRIPPRDQVGREKSATIQCARLRVAFFGRAAPSKGLDVLIQALKTRSDKKDFPFELFIFSDAAQDHGFRQRLAPLADVVHLSPPIPNAADLMSQFDVVVMPSRAEGLPLVALEALAAKTPVLATQIPGLREVFPLDWPLFVPSEDPEALMNMLFAVGRGAFDLGKLGGIGYEHVQRYSSEVCSQAYLESYREYLARD